MTTELQMDELEQVYRAVQTLYNDSSGIPMSDKQAASAWLNDFQRSVITLSLTTVIFIIIVLEPVC